MSSEEELQTRLNGYYTYGAKNYDLAMTSHSTTASNIDLVSAIDFELGDTVLDAGTGTGANLELLPRNIILHAYDTNENMLSQAKKRAARLGLEVNWHQGDLRNIALSTEVFDVSIASYVLSGCSNPQKVLGEIIRVTRTGGVIGVLDFLRTFSKPISGFSELKLEELMSELPTNIQIESMQHYTPKKDERRSQRVYLLRKIE